MKGLGDGEILAGTVRKEEGGRAQFVFSFPNGEELRSEWMSPDIERRSIIGWCETVRAEYGTRMAARSPTASPAKEVPEPVALGSAVPASGPEEMVREQVETLAKTVEALADEIKDKNKRLVEVTEDLAKWIHIAEGLGINDTIPTIHPQEQVREVPSEGEETGDVD